jgi:hypothetical protein
MAHFWIAKGGCWAAGIPNHLVVFIHLIFYDIR